MEIQTNARLVDRHGEAVTHSNSQQPLTLGSYLAKLVETGAGVDPKSAMACVRLAEKLYAAGDTLNIGDEEEKILRTCVDKAHGIAAWFRSLLEYLLWPGGMAESDRKIFESWGE
ncbi:hypothetical protein LCGC14_0746800 [marine sediment metagenome]|uniref:Uncharacterized protein n=1 Tax=marine sediment metagenome TaxID=412755 RepID=A0A0F9Q9A6_9ZZZZ